MGFLPVPDPVAFSVFGLNIYWYAICLTGGIAVGFTVLYNRTKKRGLNAEHVLDLIIWCVPIGAVAARLYYVIFEWDYFSKHLDQILNFRGGGLAIHGALIGGVATAVILLLRWKEKPLVWIDLTAPSIAIAQAIGRWGNYFNSEAHGVATDLPWAIYADGELVHPTFLYESLWCFLLFLFLLWFSNHKQSFDGQVICLYCILYSVERFFVEGLRTDSLYIGRFRQAQVLSLFVIAAAIIAYIMLRKKSISEKDE